MSGFLQVAATFASIISLPLAIILYIRSSDSKYEKVRKEIIKTLSYKIGKGADISQNDIVAVYNSKIREYNLQNHLFTQESILEDIISDVISNPFLDETKRDSILKNLNSIKESYNKGLPKEKWRKVLTFLNSRSILGLLLIIIVIYIVNTLTVTISMELNHTLAISSTGYWYLFLEMYQNCLYTNSLFMLSNIACIILTYLFLTRKHRKIL